MAYDEFRVAIIVSPARLVSLGVVAGDYAKANQWILEKRHAIDDFLQQLQGAATAGQVKSA